MKGRVEHFSAGAGSAPATISFRHTNNRGIHRITAHHPEYGQVGSMQYRDFGGQLEVGGVGVDPRVAGRGVATQMTKLALRKHGATSIVTDSLSEDGHRWAERVRHQLGVEVHARYDDDE